MQHNGWDHALKVTGDGMGLVGHVSAILLRKAADQAGLTAGLSVALRRAGKSPLFDRGAALVSMAVAVALAASSMSDIAVLAHLASVLGAAPSGSTIRRTLDLAGTPAVLDRIARARAKARAHIWKLIATPSRAHWMRRRVRARIAPATRPLTVIDIRLWTYAASTVPVSRLERPVLTGTAPWSSPRHRAASCRRRAGLAPAQPCRGGHARTPPDPARAGPRIPAGRRDGSASGPGDRSRVALPDMADHRIAVMTNHVHGGKPEFVRPHC
jgi:hypothetical protein